MCNFSSISSITDGKWYNNVPSALIKTGSLNLASNETSPLIISFN